MDFFLGGGELQVFVCLFHFVSSLANGFLFFAISIPGFVLLTEAWKAGPYRHALAGAAQLRTTADSKLLSTCSKTTVISQNTHGRIAAGPLH